LLNTAIALSSRYYSGKQQQAKELKTSDDPTDQVIPTLLELIERIDEVQPGRITTKSSSDDTVVEKISQHLALDSPKLATLLYLLSQNAQEWRPQLPLVGRTGWSALELDDLARRYPEFIRRQQRNGTTVLYAAHPRYREQIKQLLSEV